MKNQKLQETISGQINFDSLEELDVGDVVNFNVLRVYPQGSSVATPLANWEYFDGLLLSVTFVKNGFHSVEGSAVLVGPGIAICATHVISQILDNKLNAKITVLVSGISKSGLQLWKLSKFTMVGNSDLAILSLDLISKVPEKKIFNIAKITTRFPKIGESLLIVGFRASKLNFNTDTNDFGNNVFSSEGNIIVSNGPISNRFPSKRDSSMLPWPTLEVNCSTLAGMSGGPVFDKNGLLVGVLSSSFDSGPSYVSLLWQALISEIDGGWAGKFFDGKKSILELSNKICFIDKPSALNVQKNQDGTKIASVSIWE